MFCIRMKSHKLISIIIVTYNSLDLIKDCIDSVFRFNDLKDEDIEIIVVDNSDASLEAQQMKDFLEKNYFEKVKFIKNQNLGYGNGNNVGIKASTGEIICIMNPDVRLTEPLFQKTLQNFREKNVASVGYQQINKVSDYSFFKMPEFFLPLTTSLCTKWNNKKRIFNQTKYYLSGAFVFFRRKHFEQIGLYDEAYFMYFEEADVAQRLNRLKLKIVFDPSKSYLHLMEQKQDFNPKLLDIGSHSIKVYFKKYRLNLNRYINLRLIELYFHKWFFQFKGNQIRVEKARAYIQSLKKIKEETD